MGGILKLSINPSLILPQILCQKIPENPLQGQNPLSPSQPLSGIIKQALSLTSAGVERLLHDKTNQQLLKETQNKPQISLRPCSM